MGNPHGTDSRIATELTRRRTLAGFGTLLAGSTTLLLVGSDGARAEVSVDSLAVNDAAFEAEAVDPELEATVAYAYDVSKASGAVSMLVLGMDVDGSNVDEVAMSTGSDAVENTTSLSGRVVDADAWNPGHFEVAPAESVTREVAVTVWLEVHADSGDVLAESDASDVAEIVVEHPNTSGIVASIGGTVDVVDADG